MMLSLLRDDEEDDDDDDDHGQEKQRWNDTFAMLGESLRGIKALTAELDDWLKIGNKRRLGKHLWHNRRMFLRTNMLSTRMLTLLALTDTDPEPVKMREPNTGGGYRARPYAHARAVRHIDVLILRMLIVSRKRPSNMQESSGCQPEALLQDGSLHESCHQYLHQGHHSTNFTVMANPKHNVPGSGESAAAGTIWRSNAPACMHVTGCGRSVAYHQASRGAGHLAHVHRAPHTRHAHDPLAACTSMHTSEKVSTKFEYTHRRRIAMLYALI
jgi:hypothetical protein